MPGPGFPIRAKEGLEQTPYQIPRDGHRAKMVDHQPSNTRTAVLLRSKPRGPGTGGVTWADTSRGVGADQPSPDSCSRMYRPRPRTNSESQDLGKTLFLRLAESTKERLLSKLKSITQRQKPSAPALYWQLHLESYAPLGCVLQAAGLVVVAKKGIMKFLRPAHS